MLYEWKLVDTKTCLLCKTVDETLLHLFTDCTMVKSITDDIIRCTGANFAVNESYVLHVNHEDLSCVQFYIMCMLQWTIWSARNLCSLKSVPVSITSLKSRLINSVTSHLNILWLKHKSNKTQKRFLTNYC